MPPKMRAETKCAPPITEQIQGHNPRRNDIKNRTRLYKGLVSLSALIQRNVTSPGTYSRTYRSSARARPTSDRCGPLPHLTAFADNPGTRRRIYGEAVRSLHNSLPGCFGAAARTFHRIPLSPLPFQVFPADWRLPLQFMLYTPSFYSRFSGNK